MKTCPRLFIYVATIGAICPIAASGAEDATEVAALFAEGVISTPDSFGAAFTPDGNTVYFNRSTGERPNRRSTIMVAHRDGDAWAPPQPVPFSGEFNDFDVSLSPDGTRLFFASVRPETGPRPTLWLVEKDAAGEWGTPKSLAAITGTDGVAVFPSAAANGNLYFTGHRPGLASEGDDDIYVCRRLADGSYAAPENLGPAVNSPAQDYDGFIAPDESFLLFCSRRPGGIGPSDFYISVRENGTWMPARNLGPKVNWPDSPGICCPSVSTDRKWFFFTTARDGKRGIYRIEFSALEVPSNAAIPVQYWPLSTGSRIAYMRFPPARPSGALPFVFLHGGPGSYAVQPDGSARAVCERLAQRGFDVYLYDQVGSGFSNRLADPTEYTLDRHVADLEAIRQQIGCERMILLGASHGATLAANYLAAHPQRVEKAIFVSPGALDPAEHRDEVYSFPTLQLTPCFLQWIRDTRGREAARRYERFDALFRRDVHAAYAFAGDAEMDALMDAWTQERLLPRGVRDASRLPAHGRAVSGMGWWVGEMTCWDEAHRAGGVRARLASCEVPALILRGDADFLPAVFADEYAATFRRSKLVHIPNAGHLIDVDQPEAYRAAIKAFLFDENDSSHALH